VNPARDLRIHFVVEWVIILTHLPIGSGARAGQEFDACALAAWLLSCPTRPAGAVEDWKVRIWGSWTNQRIMYALDPTDVPYPDEPIYLAPATVRDAYQRVAASGKREPVRAWIRRLKLAPPIEISKTN
jgi:hypothetical protein